MSSLSNSNPSPHRKVREEGPTDDPFTRRKTLPSMNQGKKIVEEDEDDNVEMTTERLIMMEQRRKDRIEKEALDKAVQMENIRRKMDDDGAMTKKEKKKMAGGASKGFSEDIFNAHDFDIDINVSEMAVRITLFHT